MIRSKKPSLSTDRVKKAATRYRPGQQPQGYEQRSDSESDSESDGQKEDQERKEDQYINEEIVSEDVTSAWAKRRGRSTIHEDDREESDEEKDEKPGTSGDEDQQPFPSIPYRRPFEKSPPSAAQPFEEVSEESESEESSSEEEVEEHYKPVVLYKPVFVPKGSRKSTAGGVTGQADLDDAEVEKRRELEQERRRVEAHELAQQVVEREKLRIKAKNAGSEVALDDTDGLDPDGEYQEWKLRELSRSKRDQDERNARAVEQAETAARRALPEEVRLKQDIERAQQSRMSKVNRSDTVQSKGAFYRDNLQSIPAKDRSAPSEMESFRKNRLPKSLRGLQSKKSKHV